MSGVTKVTKDNFDSLLAKAVSADNSLAGRIQRLITFGFAEYDTNQNSNWLTAIMTAGWSATRTGAIQVYIEDHTDLVFTKMKDGDHRFKREAVEGYSFTMPEKTWTEYSGVGQALPIDPDKKLETLVNQLGAAIKGDGKKKLVAGTEAEAGHLLAYLKAFKPLETGATVQ